MDHGSRTAAESGAWRPERIIEGLRGSGPALVALSGGVDSAVVAALAHAALGENAWAVTLTGPAVSDAEVERAGAVARALGLRHEFLPVDPLGSAEYRANPSNRCFFCRQVETARLREWGEPRGVRRYLDGVQLDDLGDERPGLRAMDAAGFEHPLVRAGWTKRDVRAHAREIGLPNADAPSDACLASRVRHGEPITGELLSRIARSEALLRERGFRRVRVRSEGLGARIEVGPDEVDRLLEEPLASEVRRDLGAAGFASVVFDPRGYRRDALA